MGLVVGADGVSSGVEVLRSPSEALAAAALAAVGATRFTPGTIGGEPIAVQLALPIRFRLPDAALEAGAAYYESDAGRHVTVTVARGMLRYQLPRMIETVGAMFEGMPPPTGDD